VLASSVLCAERDAAAQVRAVRVDCRLDAERGAIRGRVEIDLANPTSAPLDRVYLWLYPNRLARVPESTDEVSFYWLYPRRPDAGSMSLESVAVGGARAPARWRAEPHAAAGPGALWSIVLPEPLAPGASMRLRAAYRAHAPTRYGGFGCVDGGCTLMGGFYPMPAALDAAGWDLEAAPDRTDLDVAVELARPGSMVLFDQWSGNDAVRLRVRAPSSPYATLVAAPRLFESRRLVGGAVFRFLSPEPPPPADDARRVLFQYTLEDYAAHALDTAAAAAALLRDLDPALRPRALTMVSAPLRAELASAHDRVVLVSDRFFRILPAERLRKFHRRQLARAVFAHQLIPRLAGREDAERDDAVDLVASYLADLFVVRRYDTAEFVQNILKPASFVPAIDQLLYAPQTLFSEAYFGDQAAGDPLRDDPRRFMHLRPRGRLYYEKLRDLVGPTRLEQAMRAVLIRGQDHRAAAAAAAGAPVDWFFRQWSLPHPHVDYRLVSHSARPMAGGRFENRVVVARDTEPGDRPPVEPVTVLATDGDGARHRLRWSGRGQRAALRYVSSSPVEWAWVDPDARLIETSVGRPSQHARFNNRDHHPLRFVYNNLGLLFNVSDLTALIAADFTLSRVHDLENEVRLVAFTSADVRYGGVVTYGRSFGREVTPDRLLGRASLSLGASRLDSDFFTAGAERGRAATQLSLTAALGGDDQVFLFEPLARHEARASASLTVTRRDAISDPMAGEPSDVLLSGQVDAWTSRTITPRAGHTLAAELGAAAAVGDIESRSQLIAAGGATGIRGFAPGSLYGRALASARGEYRHSFIHDLDWNLGHYSFVRGFGGVAFVDVGMLSPCDSYVPSGKGAFYTSVGYGLQYFYDNFGTLAGLTRVDLAVRVTGEPERCLGETRSPGPAAQLYITFLPPF
jgi:hypothetical protein